MELPPTPVVLWSEARTRRTGTSISAAAMLLFGSGGAFPGEVRGAVSVSVNGLTVQTTRPRFYAWSDIAEITAPAKDDGVADLVLRSGSIVALGREHLPDPAPVGLARARRDLLRQLLVDARRRADAR